MALKKGGFLNTPVFLPNDATNVCNRLNIQNPKEFIYTKTEVNDTLNDAKIAPLLYFLSNIKKECLHNEGVIALQDSYDNYIFFSENVTDDEKEIDVFKINDKFQIEYLKEKKFGLIKDQIYTFDDFINDNKQKVNEHYSLFDMKISDDENMIVEILNKYDIIQNFCKEKNIKIEPMVNFKNFIEKYCSIQKNTNVTINIIYNENFNLIKFMAFINMVPELFELIDNDYKYYEDSYNNPLLILDKLTPLLSQKQITSQIDRLLRGKNYNFKKQVSNTENYNNQREFLKTFITDNEELLKDPIYIIYICDKFIKDNLDYLDDEYNYFKKFRYALCLFNYTISDDESYKIPVNLYEKITNAYNYKDLGDEILSIERLLKKQNTVKERIKKINNLLQLKKGMHYFNFIDNIIEFLDDIHNIRKEFVKNIICFYKDFIKLFIGQCYYNYLQNESYTLPISIKTHSITYDKISKINTKIPDIFLEEEGVYYMPLIKQIRIEKDNYVFMTCGETTLLNFIKYLLTDKTEKKITMRTLDILKKNFPNHRLDQIFDEDLANITTDIKQTKLLQNRLQKFSELLYYDENEKEKLYGNPTIKCELSPSLHKSMYILQKILGKTDIIKGKNFIEQISSIFGKKYNKESNGIIENDDDEIVYDDNVVFIFDNGHAETSSKKKNIDIKDYNDFIINKLLKTDSQNNHYNMNNIFHYGNRLIDGLSTLGSGMINQIFNELYIQYTLEDYLEFLKANSYKILEFNSSFNSKIPTFAFSAAEIIRFGNEYNQPIDDHAFLNCKEVSFRVNFNSQISASAFPIVENIKYGASYILYDKTIQYDYFESKEQTIYNSDLFKRIYNRLSIKTGGFKYYKNKYLKYQNKLNKLSKY